ELGVSHAAVETLLFRARRSLAEQLTAPRQTRRRGPLRSLNLGSLLATLKSFFSGAAAFKAVVAVAVAGSSVLALHDVAHPRAAAGAADGAAPAPAARPPPDPHPRLAARAAQVVLQRCGCVQGRGRGGRCRLVRPRPPRRCASPGSRAHPTCGSVQGVEAAGF